MTTNLSGVQFEQIDPPSVEFIVSLNDLRACVSKGCAVPKAMFEGSENNRSITESTLFSLEEYRKKIGQRLLGG